MATVVGTGKMVNGLDLDELADVAHEMERDPAKGQVEFRVCSEWKGQLRSRTSVDSYTIGAGQVHRNFTIDADEITPSMKVKRKMIDKNYKSIIDGLYVDENADEDRDARRV